MSCLPKIRSPLPRLGPAPHKSGSPCVSGHTHGDMVSVTSRRDSGTICHWKGAGCHQEWGWTHCRSHWDGGSCWSHQVGCSIPRACPHVPSVSDLTVSLCPPSVLFSGCRGGFFLLLKARLHQSLSLRLFSHLVHQDLDFFQGVPAGNGAWPSSSPPDPSHLSHPIPTILSPQSPSQYSVLYSPSQPPVPIPSYPICLLCHTTIPSPSFLFPPSHSIPSYPMFLASFYPNVSYCPILSQSSFPILSTVPCPLFSFSCLHPLACPQLHPTTPIVPSHDLYSHHPISTVPSHSILTISISIPIILSHWSPSRHSHPVPTHHDPNLFSYPAAELLAQFSMEVPRVCMATPGGANYLFRSLGMSLVVGAFMVTLAPGLALLTLLELPLLITTHRIQTARKQVRRQEGKSGRGPQRWDKGMGMVELRWRPGE